jgi:hypothetical protein
LNATLEKAVVLAVPVALVLGYSVARFARAKTLSSLLQLLGAGCLFIVVLTHVAEALHILPSMGWGEPHSVPGEDRKPQRICEPLAESIVLKPRDTNLRASTSG